jgi:hypothetical protein
MRRSLFVFMTLLSIAGCKKSTSTPNSGGVDATNTPDASGSEPGGTMYTVKIEVDNVPANLDHTQCIWLNLGNTEPIKVHEIHDTLSSGSHHMIVYKDDMDTTEQTTPTDCQPFTGALNTSGNIEPLVITQKADDDVVLPGGVAYTFGAGQMIKLELHYINTTDQPENITGTVTFIAADASTIQNEAALLFTGSPDIGCSEAGCANINGNGSASLHQFFTVPSYIDLSQAHIFAITGHEHQLGTGVTVNVAPSASGPFTPVYNPPNFTWNEPPTQQQNPDFAVPAGGGFDFTCTWFSNNGQTVKFGEKATNEMCFFWAYYWPSQGSKVCVHTDQVGGGYDACCPGDSACSLIEAGF